MIDDLRRTLGNYSLAATEIPPTQHYYFRTGNYILYSTAAYKAVGAGGHWQLPNYSTAAYQLLQNRTSGARVLVVSVHLISGSGAANDAIRQKQTTSLLSLAGAKAAAVKAPIIYGGDFNSDINSAHAFDGPGIAMRAAGIVDARNVAQTLYNPSYNSANQYLRTPPAFSQNIDYVYAPAGVAVGYHWVLLRLVRGQFSGAIPSDHNPVQASLYIPY